MSDSLGIVHWRATRSQFGTASQARTETLLFGCLRTAEKSAVCFLGRFRRANRAAVNVGRRHAHEKNPIKSRVASRQRPVQPRVIFTCHGPNTRSFYVRILAVFGHRHNRISVSENGRNRIPAMRIRTEIEGGSPLPGPLLPFTF